MPRTKSDNDYQVAFKVPVAWLGTADEIVSRRSVGGFTTTRTEVLRAALKTGLECLELETAPEGVVVKSKRRGLPRRLKDRR